MTAERIVCGCGAHLPCYGYRPEPGSGVIYWRGAPVMFSGDRKRFELLDHTGRIVHACTLRSWPKDGRVHLASEAA